MVDGPDSSKKKDGEFSKKFVFVRSFDGFEGAGDICYVQNTLVVANYTHSNISVLDMNGKRLIQFGQFGTKDGEFCRPCSIASDSHHLYISDVGKVEENDDDEPLVTMHRIQIFTLDGQFVKSFPSPAPHSSLCLDNGLLFATDWKNHSVHVLSIDGKLLRSIDCSANGEKRSPFSLSVYDDQLIIGDEGGLVRFQKTSGQFINVFNILDKNYDVIHRLLMVPEGLLVIALPAIGTEDMFDTVHLYQ